MKKWVRKTMAVALSGALLLGASGMALAANATQDSSSKLNDSTSGTDGAAPDTNFFYLIKTYNNSSTVTTYTESPADSFTYTITPYGVWNADSTYASGLVSTTNAPIPMLNRANSTDAGTGVTYDTSTTNQLIVYQAVDAGQAGNSTDRKAKVELPDYTAPGDYWYQVRETIGTTAGVIYGTNSKTDSATVSGNSNYTATYYIHVQATTPISNGTCVRNVTMHKTPPSTGVSTSSTAYNNASNTTYDTGDKVNAIENQYYAGDLVIKKAVSGNAGEPDRFFKVTVVFTKPTGTNVNSTISYTAIPFDNTNPDAPASSSTASAQTINSINWDGTTDSATATFWIKSGDANAVTFHNIPYGVTYTVQETLPANDNYENELKFTSADTSPSFNGNTLDNDTDSANLATASNGTPKQATGSISDANDEITITNQKNVAIDVGVITEDAPYVALMAVCAGAAVLMVTRKKRIFED